MPHHDASSHRQTRTDGALAVLALALLLLITRTGTPLGI